MELFDRASLRECEADEEMARLVPDILGADPMAAALLIECRGQDAAALQAGIEEVNKAMLRHKLPFGAKAAEPRPLETYAFSLDPKVGCVSLSLVGARGQGGAAASGGMRGGGGLV